MAKVVKENGSTSILEAVPDCTRELRAMLRAYSNRRTPISVNFRRLVSTFRSADRATHLVHPYPAKLLMHIPAFFLANDILSRQGDTVLDAFCGSGTVPLEAQLAGRQAVAADCNPMALIITRVKTQRLNPLRLKLAAARLVRHADGSHQGKLPDVVNLRHWFYPAVIKQLQNLAASIHLIRNRNEREFFLVCFSACVRKVSLADPRLAVPVKLRSKARPPKHEHINGKTKQRLQELRRINVRRVFDEIVNANIVRSDALFRSSTSAWRPARVISKDARCLFGTAGEHSDAGIEPGSIQLTITSPPYPGAQKYIRSSSLSLGWLGLCPSSKLIDFKRKTIGREEISRAETSRRPRTSCDAANRALRKLYERNPVRAVIASSYLNEMEEVLRQIHMVTRPGGYLVLVAANGRLGGQPFRTVSYLQSLAQGCGFCLVLKLIDTIRSRGLMTKRNRTASVMTREWVLVFQKGGNSDG